MIHLRPRHRRRRKRKTRTLIRHNKVNEKSSTIPSFLVGMWSIFALLARLQSHRQCVRARKHYAQFMTPPLEKKSGGLQQSCFFTVQVAFLFGNLINCLRDRKRPKLTTRVTGVVVYWRQKRNARPGPHCVLRTQDSLVTNILREIFFFSPLSFWRSLPKFLILASLKKGRWNVFFPTDFPLGSLETLWYFLV